LNGRMRRIAVKSWLLRTLAEEECDKIEGPVTKIFATVPSNCTREVSPHISREEKGVHDALPNIRQNRITGFGDRLWRLGDWPIWMDRCPGPGIASVPPKGHRPGCELY